MAPFLVALFLVVLFLMASEPARPGAAGQAHAETPSGAPVAEAVPLTPGTPGTADGPLQFDTNLGLIERATMQAVQEALEGLRLDPGSDILLHPMTTSEGGWFVEDCIARVLSQKGYSVHLVSAEEVASRTNPPGRTVPPAGSGSSGGAVPPGVASTGSLADAVTQTNTPGSNAGAAPSDSIIDPAQYRRQHQRMLQQAAEAGNNAPNTPPEPETVNPVPPGEGLVLSYRIIEFGVTYHDSWRRGFMGPRMVERLASVNLYTRLVNGTAEDVLWVGRGRAERLDVVPKAKLDLLEGRNYPFLRPELRGRPLSRLAEPILVSSIIAGLVFLFYSSQN